MSLEKAPKINRLTITRVGLAALLLLMSLGLPWGQVVGKAEYTTQYHSGYFIAGACRLKEERRVTGEYWFVTECEPPMSGLPWQTQDVTIGKDKSIDGAVHQARFGVVGGLVLLVMGWRLRRTRYFLWAACCVSISSVLTSGLGFDYAGSSLAWLATALLLSMGAVGSAAHPNR
jgi:hypothetical protein